MSSQPRGYGIAGCKPRTGCGWDPWGQKSIYRDCRVMTCSAGEQLGSINSVLELAHLLVRGVDLLQDCCAAFSDGNPNFSTALGDPNWPL